MTISQKIKNKIKSNSKKISTICYIIILLLFILFILSPLIPMESHYWFSRYIIAIYVVLIAVIFEVDKSLRTRYVIATFIILPFFVFIGPECASFVKRMSLKRSDINICFVIDKTKENVGYKGVKYAYYLKLSGIDRIYEEPCRVNKKTYDDVEIGDTMLLKVSKSFPHIYSVYDWEPTHEEINKYMVPRPVINDVEQTISDDSIKYLRSIIMSKMAEKREQESLKKKREEQIKEAEIKQYYKQLGYIFKKNSRGITKQFNTMVYFGKEKAKQWKLERSMFENINVGDTLLLEFSDENEDYCKVISWHPTPEEKELYRTQVQKGNDITTPTTTE